MGSCLKIRLCGRRGIWFVDDSSVYGVTSDTTLEGNLVTKEISGAFSYSTLEVAGFISR